MALTGGDQFAGFKIVRLLGAGGMGEVYLVQHPRLPRREALKILPITVSSDPEYRQRFYREAELAASLWHPNIVGVHDRGEADGQLWISMDYVEGTDTAQLLRNQAGEGLPPADVLEIVSAVADALDYAHDQGMLHRDVKPANILLTEPTVGARRVLLADFGIAREIDDISGLTATNMTVGTVSYAAPEQLMDAQMDGRADQYSLAATTFHLLSGSPPFQHSNPAVVISRHLNASPPLLSDSRPDLRDLDAVLARALAKDPADRFDRCADFAGALMSSASAPTREWESNPGSAETTPRGASQQKDAAQKPGAGPNIATDSRDGRSWRRPVIFLPVALALSVVAALVFVGLQLGRGRTTSEPTVSSPSSTSTAAEISTDAAASTTQNSTPPPSSTSATLHPVFARYPVRLPFNDLNLPQSLAVDPTGSLFVGDWSVDGGRILQLPAGTTTPTPLPVTGLEGPCAMTVDHQQTLYVLDGCSNAGSRLLKIPAGSTTPIELTPELPAGGKDIAVDSKGNLYLVCSNRFGAWLVKLAPAATKPIELAHDGIESPTSVAVDSSDNVYVAGYPGKLGRIAAGSTALDVLPFAASGDAYLSDISVDAGGTVYLLETRTGPAPDYVSTSKIFALPEDASTALELSVDDRLTNLDAIVADATGIYMTTNGSTPTENGSAWLLRRSE